MTSLDNIRAIATVSTQPRGLVEGPRLGEDGSAWFSDVTLGGVYRVDPAGRLSVELPKRRGVGGLVLHADGGVVVTGRTVLHRTARGEGRTLLERNDVSGFNDLTTMADGTLLVGALRYRPMAGEEPVEGLLLHVQAPGRATVVSDSIVWPNGIAVEAAGTHVLISDFARQHVKRVALDGSGESVHCDSARGSCDGLALDVEGGLWVALGHGGGVARFASDGRLEEIFEMPAEFVSSIAFGGADGRDALIATADERGSALGGTLLRARSSVAGAPVARVQL